MKKLTRMEWATATATMLLVGTCVFLVIMAKVMGSVFFAMYSDAHLPWITEVFLAGDRWGFIFPLLAGIPTFLIWNKGKLNSDGPLLLVGMHMISVVVLVIVALGIMLPLLTSTWRILGS